MVLKLDLEKKWFGHAGITHKKREKALSFKKGYFNKKGLSLWLATEKFDVNIISINEVHSL